MPRELTVALITEVFPSQDSLPSLYDCLELAGAAGATLAILPELPLNPWSPAEPEPKQQDAEHAGGPRERMLSAAAAHSNIAVLGGVIRLDARTGMRYNTAILVDQEGRPVLEYEKVHLPQEDGFWEASHYCRGRFGPQTAVVQGARIGVQICSDANRPTGAQLLAAQGVEVILAPRATEAANYRRWRIAYQAMALTTGAFVISVNRPGPEAGVPIGGPSLAVDPSGNVLGETVDPMTVLALDLDHVARARESYPGYMEYASDIYAAAWKPLHRTKL